MLHKVLHMVCRYCRSRSGVKKNKVFIEALCRFKCVENRHWPIWVPVWGQVGTQPGVRLCLQTS